MDDSVVSPCITPFQQLLPRKAVVKFGLSDDPLFKYEETRDDKVIDHEMSREREGVLKPTYLIDFEFTNISKVCLEIYRNTSSNNPHSSTNQQANQISVKMYISVSKPCPVQKVYPNSKRPQYARSPFKLELD